MTVQQQPLCPICKVPLIPNEYIYQQFIDAGLPNIFHETKSFQGFKCHEHDGLPNEFLILSDSSDWCYNGTKWVSTKFKKGSPKIRKGKLIGAWKFQF